MGKFMNSEKESKYWKERAPQRRTWWPHRRGCRTWTLGALCSSLHFLLRCHSVHLTETFPPILLFFLFFFNNHRHPRDDLWNWPQPQIHTQELGAQLEEIGEFGLWNFILFKVLEKEGRKEMGNGCNLVSGQLDYIWLALPALNGYTNTSIHRSCSVNSFLNFNAYIYIY